MAHNRKLVLSGIALTKARIPPKLNAMAANQVRDEIEREIIRSGYLEGAEFSWIGISIRYGLIDEAAPHYEPIDVEDGELAVSIEIDVNRLLGVSVEEMEQVYREAVLLVLRHVGEKYRLNNSVFGRNSA